MVESLDVGASSEWDWSDWAEAFDMTTLLPSNQEGDDDANSPSSAVKDALGLQFHLPITSGDVVQGNYSVMPSLRLDMLKRQYHEPIRDRDKDWAIESQRDLLNVYTDSNRLPLGKYKLKESLGPLEWSPSLQILVRRIRMHSCITVISHTYCSITVYGLGLSGRLVSEGGNNLGRYLIIEAYSAWNSFKYVVMIPAIQLRSILGPSSSLLKTGLRSAAIDAIIKQLYFKYEIHLTYPNCGGIASTPATDSDTQVCTHLDPPHLPEGLPQTLPDVIHFVQSGLSTPTMSITLTQELCVGYAPLDNGPKISRLTYKQRLADDEAELVRRRKDWLDTPMRKRGLQFTVARRSRGKMMVISAYRMPRKPLNLSLRCHVPIECVSLPVSIALLSAGAEVNIQSNPNLWSKEVLKHVSKCASLSVRLRWLEKNSCLAYYKGAFSSVENASPLLINSACIKERKICFVNELPKLDLSVSQYNYTPCQPYESKISRIVPRREVGRGLRISSRVTVIQGVNVILTLYLRSPLMKGTLPKDFNLSLVIDAAGKQDFDKMNAYFGSLCLSLDIHIDVYIPNEQFCGVKLEGSTTLRAKMNREDIFQLIGRDLDLFVRMATIGYEAYYLLNKSDVLARRVAHAWDNMMDRLVTKAHWAVIPPLSQISNDIELNMRDARCKLFIQAERVDVSLYEALYPDAYEIKVKDDSTESVVILQWAAQIFHKAMLIEEEGNPKPRLLQMTMWQQGLRLGILAFDRLRCEVFAAESSYEEQRAQIESFRCLSETERAVNITVYISLGLRYFVKQEDEKEHRGIKLGDYEADMGVRLSAEEFANQAAAATEKASEDVYRRLLAAKKGGDT